MYKIKFSLLIFGILSLFSISSEGSLENVSSSKMDLTCPHVLQSSSADLKGMLLQMKLIINRIEVTSINKNILDDILKILLKWRNHQDDQRIEIEALLTILYFFHVLPSVALTSSNLYVHIDFDKLKSRPYPPETNIQQLLIIINRHLRSHIREFQSEFAIDLDRTEFSIEDLAKAIHVPHQILSDIFNTDFVPNYLQMTQILNKRYSTVVTFFKKIESSQEFREIFNSYYSKTIEEKEIINNGTGADIVNGDIGRRVIYNRLNEGVLYNIYMERLQSRLPVILAKLTPHISQLDRSQRLELPDITNIELESVTMSQLLKLAHVFNKELLQILVNNNFSLLYPINLETLREMEIQLALHRLTRNIRREMNIFQISIYDLSVHLGLSESAVESILDRKTVMTYHQFAQICQKVWDGRGDPLILLKRFLRGVSTLYYKEDYNNRVNGVRI